MEKAGVHKCYFCHNEFDWKAHFTNPPVDSSLKTEANTAVLDVIARSSIPTDLGKKRAIELEVITQCPNCKAKNRIVTFLEP